MSAAIGVPSVVIAGRYARQVIFPAIGAVGQERLGRSRVCLIGVGALGSHVADLLVRAGIGYLRLVDRDVPELTNLQRQSLYDESDLDSGVPKAVAAARRLAAANSEVELDPHVADVNQGNVEALIADVDLVIDGSDNFEVRYLVNDACLKLGKPWVYGGVIASYGMSMTVLPGVTPCLRCVFPDPPAPGEAPTCDTAGVIGPAVAVVAGLQAAEALKLAVGADDARNRDLVAIDVWDLSFDRIALGDRREDCPACGRHEYTFLDRAAPSQTTQLCGRDAVQVLVHPPARIALASLAERLSALGSVRVNAFLLRCELDRYDLTVFPDGRAIIKGTTDASEARAVYARYIGM
ncbi:MAG TPA: ThiF family adenylyltransferase [Thermomicrobiaceae bacterium]|nr:ThiF family adenylyltransferase [Thermomicrobiaceae bacterium]